MKAAKIYRRSIADCGASHRCAELTLHFGAPYALHDVWGTRYGWEHRRLGPSDLPLGCLNQPWIGPAVVWYPAGNWMLPPDDTRSLEKQDEEV
jgi:hypothetical protein